MEQSKQLFLMNVTLAFQYTLKKDSTLREKIETKLIQWWTRCKYFHVEVIIEDKWVSSGPSHGGAFVQELRPLNHERYDYFSVDVDGRKRSKVWRFIDKQIGTGYDWAGIWLSQTFRFGAHNKEQWFCSEIVSEILKRFGVELKHHSNLYSPKGLFKELEFDRLNRS